MDPAHVHRSFFGELSAVHRKLYESGRFRGLSSRDPSKEEFEATFFLALAQVVAEKGKWAPTFFFFPEDKREWVLASMKETIRGMVRYLRARTQGVSKEALERLKRAFQEIQMGSRCMNLPEEPPRWAAIGYDIDHPELPAWARDKLL